MVQNACYLKISKIGIIRMKSAMIKELSKRHMQDLIILISDPSTY